MRTAHKRGVVVPKWGTPKKHTKSSGERSMPLHETLLEFIEGRASKGGKKRMQKMFAENKRYADNLERERMVELVRSIPVLKNVKEALDDD